MRNPEIYNIAYRRLSKEIKFLTALERYGCDWETVSKFVGLTVPQAKKYYVIINKRFEREAREERRRNLQQIDSQESEDRPGTRTVGVQYAEGLYLPEGRESLI